MIKHSPLFICLLVCSSWLAQGQQPTIDTAAYEYHSQRMANTHPDYHLQKLQQMIAVAPTKGRERFGPPKAITPKAYLALSLREKFTYNLYEEESWSQVCSNYPYVREEAKKLFAFLPRASQEFCWSDRQIAFFRDNRDSVIILLTESINDLGRVGLNYKKVIVDINAKEMIPLLINTYNRSKTDHDILTVLMLLMRDNKYPSFMGNAFYDRFYGDGRVSPLLAVHIDLDPATEQLILSQAADFYNGLSK